MTQLDRIIEYDLITGEKTIHSETGDSHTVDMDNDELFEFVKLGEYGIDDLPEAYNNFDTLNTIYKEINPKDQIANEIIEDMNIRVLRTEINEIYLVEKYSDKISEKIKGFISELYTTNDIYNILESDITYNQFVVDEVDNIIFRIIELWEK